MILNRRAVVSVAVVAAFAAATAGCNSSDSGSTGGSGTDAGAKQPPIAVDLPRADSDFWNSYAKYIPQYAQETGINMMTPTNSQNDIAKLVANAQALTAQGAKAIVMAPQDTGAIATTLTMLESKKIPVVSVDTRPDKGKVFMVVRADNRAYGQKACEFLGEKLGGKGKVIEFQGSLSSVNGRDRSEAFAECMKSKFPGITIFEEPTEWEGAKASAALQTRLAQHPDIKGIYMQAGGVFLAPTLQLLKSKNALVPPTDPKHIFIVSNDGIPQEFDAIRKGEIDATVSQPADLYAKYALFYAKAAVEGKTFTPGPTDHDSTIIDVGNGVLEDQLPAPLVTKDNVDDASLWGNQIGK
ncbi:simple sugar transport system substrate-binding protein/ribose transport system substrate-binding protein [Asanoa ferruginea]|uniref:Simple sugar transport system substrate-binding protein/ribose transport system substrate-binding protein n=1 Tax=Asanoa ferruginea TaxID=53367 RepID=A0A3D9ZM06_9ACTN|nr:sugar ABC transporter substrate-binding protein [Asanoa ferruginea]REF98418.1 simple sugar transport system substrate-binding protein/ribose transport system substrate-binding protein [Asanoa ferruginea]GIF53708.1 ABC transporter substrate-binding protein [Asanoa ferruginea]